jgi:hypothetical protein
VHLSITQSVYQLDAPIPLLFMQKHITILYNPPDDKQDSSKHVEDCNKCLYEQYGNWCIKLVHWLSYLFTSQLLWRLWNITILKTKHLLLGNGYCTPVQKICFLELFHKFVLILFINSSTENRCLTTIDGTTFSSSFLLYLRGHYCHNYWLVCQILIPVEEIYKLIMWSFDIVGNVYFCCTSQSFCQNRILFRTHVLLSLE